MSNINGYEIAFKISECDEVELMEFDFCDCFTALNEYEQLKKENKELKKHITCFLNESSTSDELWTEEEALEIIKCNYECGE